jgi:trimeric autotransporter adhesin
MAIVLDGTSGITTPDLTDTSLTSGRVVYAGTGGNLTGSTALTFDGAILGVNGISVGRGAGAVATNTAVGASAFTTNTTGANSVAVGAFSLGVNSTGNDNTAVGYGAGYYITGSGNTAVGRSALSTGTSGASGGSNTAVGFYALQANTTASGNTAVGYQAGYTNTTGNELVAVGFEALKANTTGYSNTAVGHQASALNTTGYSNIAVGRAALYANTTGIENTALGYYALVANTTASYNTAVGRNSLLNCTTGTHNTVIGHNSGDTITTGTKNTILGRYNGNQGGLDIRTLSNFVVASDGDGNLAFHNSSSQWTTNAFANIDITQGTAGGSATNTLGVTQSTATGIFGNTNSFSGIFIINDMNQTGEAALILAAGNTLKIISQVASVFVVTSSPNASQIGVYISSSIVYVKPGLAGTTNFRIMAFRTRATQ